MDEQTLNTTILSLGAPKTSSPLSHATFVDDSARVIYNTFLQDYDKCVQTGKPPITLELAGPRREIYFEPKKTRSAIVTCGGLCPGLNNVIRAIVLLLHYEYGSKEIIGFRYGYKGLVETGENSYISLTPSVVTNIHTTGGSILSSSRGPQEIQRMVDTLENLHINILFTIGGDGTLRGAHCLTEEINRRKLKISVIGIPKTIDNDIPFISKSFGFETAFSTASMAIQSAHVEAKGAPYGIGLVKLMGRHSGFITANASLAQKDVNFCLIPEIDFDMEGEHGLLNQVKKRLVARGHAVIVVAEGAGQKFFDQENAEVDDSGNKKLEDIGIYLKQKLTEYFKNINMSATLKYIDPSYIIRSIPAIPGERVFCGLLAQNAVHAAMSGKTDMIIGIRNNMFVHVPIGTAIKERKHVNPKGSLWQCVISSTGQPELVSANNSRGSQ
ncbi:MAG: ATP-dependent 6-phosphofructokinase [Candidatus Anammoxibacter sp.]